MRETVRRGRTLPLVDVAPVQTSAWRRARRRRAVAIRRRVVSLLAAPLYVLYTKRLRELVMAQTVPRHVAVILDGNRRWASLAGLREPGAGHRHGADKLDELLAWCERVGVSELTVWALSTENLSRASGEVDALVDVLVQKLDALAEEGRDEARFRVRVFGRIESLPPALASAARRVQAETAGGDRLCLNIALGYSGRETASTRMHPPGWVARAGGAIRWLARQYRPADSFAADFYLVTGVAAERSWWQDGTRLAQPDATVGVGTTFRALGAHRIGARIEVRVVFELDDDGSASACRGTCPMTPPPVGPGLLATWGLVW